MTSICPICGSVLPDGELCRERFERCLVLDYERPESYGAVHHLVVACWMMQHNEYSREGWLYARALIERAMREGTTPSELRKLSRERVDSSRRRWSVTRGEKLAGVESIRWSRTVADVRLDSSEIYSADVKRWAESVLSDSETMMHR